MVKLVLVDQNIEDLEYQSFQTRLKQIISDCVFKKSIQEVITQKGEKVIVIISGFVIQVDQKPLNTNQIVFCSKGFKPFEKFLQNNHMLVLVFSNIQLLELYVKLNLQFLNAQESLNIQFCKKVEDNPNYSHQIEETSFRFLLINQKLQLGFKESEQSLEDEIKSLIGEEALQKLKKELEKKKQKTKKEFSLFEKLIFYYTCNELHSVLNINFAKSNYEQIEQIMCVLFQGYSKFQQKQLTTNTLYRGITFQNNNKMEEYFNQLEQCQQKHNFMFWNALASTSINQAVACGFLQPNCNILFEIILIKENPHPCFLLTPLNSKYLSEEEVLLFPQFQFKILELIKNQEKYGKTFIYCKIQQIQNNFSMALDENKRKLYWEERIKNDLKPKLQIIASFYQIRIKQVISFLKTFAQDRRNLKMHLDDYFQKFVYQLQLFCDNRDNYKNQLSQLLEVLYKKIKFENNITDEMLDLINKFISNSSERIIEEFILIIKKIYNLENFEMDIQRSFQTFLEEAEETRKYRENRIDLYEILASLNCIDEFILIVIVQMFRKQKIQDYKAFFDENNEDYGQQILQQILEVEKNLSFFDKERMISILKNTRNQILLIIECLKQHDFSRNDYYTETKRDIRLIQLREKKQVIEFLKFLVHLTAVNNEFIVSGSNSLNLLVEMKIDLKQQCFENIKIKNTSVIGGNFARCSFCGSEFDNVDISGVNLNGALLLNCKWKKIKIHELNKIDGYSDCVRSVCFSSNGTTLASGSDDKSIRLWDVKTGQQKGKLDGHSKTIYSICFSPDGTTLASGSDDKSIRLWDVKTGQQKGKLDGHSETVYSVCFSPDGTTLASGSGDTSISLWDVTTGQQNAQLNGHNRGVLSVYYSPDGTTLISGSYDNSIRLWNVKKKYQKAKIVGHESWVYSVCFSPDGTTLASGSGDNSICLHDVETRQQKAKLAGHTSFVYSVCFSPDGTTLASGSGDKSIRLWDVKTGQQKAKLDGHSNSIRSVCFSPDGTTLASGSGDNSISLWDVKTEQQIQPQDQKYKDLLTQCKLPLNQKLVNPYTEGTQHINIFLISQSVIFQAKGALILEGEFVDRSGQDLKQFLKSKGSYFLEINQQQQVKKNQ